MKLQEMKLGMNEPPKSLCYFPGLHKDKNPGPVNIARIFRSITELKHANRLIGLPPKHTRILQWSLSGK